MKVFFQTMTLGRTDVYCQDRHPGLLALMMQRSHLPIFKPHLSFDYKVPQILVGTWPPKTDYVDAERGRYVFLLDRSGSMQGGKIELAKEALRIFLQSLPAESEFQVVSFGTEFSYLLGTSKMIPLNRDTVREAAVEIATFQADMGGTLIYPALKACYDNLLEKVGNECSQQIFVLTDGAIMNVREIVELAGLQKHLAEVHTFGLGE